MNFWARRKTVFQTVLIILGIVVKIIFQKSGVFDVPFHPVRPFCLTMKISLILEGFSILMKIEKMKIMKK